MTPAARNATLVPSRAHVRLAAALAAATLLLLVLAASPARASLAAVGPVDPANGYPAYYEDAAGTRLKYCFDPADGCVAELPNPDAPVSFPDNFPDEAFWFLAEATGGKLRLYRAALEGAFLNGAVAAGDQMTFSRVRVRATQLVPGAEYTITHPYGVLVRTAVATPDNGGVINVTLDDGCAAAPCDFGLARAAFNGDAAATSANFLTWTTAPPAGTIGDFNTPHAVTGSPFGTNFVRIEGPDAGGPGSDVLTVTQFGLMGVTAPAAADGTPSTPDLTPASDSGSSTTDNITNDSTPTFSGDGATPGATVELLVDGSTTAADTTIAGAGGQWALTAPALADGIHRFRARTPGTPDKVSGVLAIDVDTRGPVSSIGFPRPSDPTADTTPTFVFSADEDAVAFRCSLKLTTAAPVFAPCDPPTTYDEQLPGLYAFRVHATDRAGNTGADDVYTFRIGQADNPQTVTAQAPSVALGAAPAPTVQGTSVAAVETAPVIISWPAATPSLNTTYQLELRLDGVLVATLNAGSGRRVTRQLSDGSWDLSVIATNNGVSDTSPVTTVEVTLDQAPTSLTGTWSTATAGTWWNGSLRFATAASATQTYDFTGQSFGLVSDRGPARGRMVVTLDGGGSTIDTFNGTAQNRRILFSRNALTGPLHRVIVRPEGSRNAQSTSNRIDVDGFVVLNTVP